MGDIKLDLLKTALRMCSLVTQGEAVYTCRVFFIAELNRRVLLRDALKTLLTWAPDTRDCVQYRQASYVLPYITEEMEAKRNYCVEE
jgi:hypothetical protein